MLSGDVNRQVTVCFAGLAIQVAFFECSACLASRRSLSHMILNWCCCYVCFSLVHGSLQLHPGCGDIFL